MAADLEAAKAALARGEYERALSLLEPLSKQNPLPGKEGAQIRMLMVTAWMGQGQEQKAIDTSRLVSRCKDESLRQLAKQLLTVLEAPNLGRPKNWSVQLPSFDMTAISSSSKGSYYRGNPENHLK